MSSSFDWHPSSKGQSVFKVETRNLGWWVVLAILVSVILHIFLYIILAGIERSGLAANDETIVWRSQREQITIDQEKLNQLLDEPFIPEETALEPEKLSDLDLVDKSLDEFDLMEQMKEETIRMSPIETPQIFSAEAPRAPGEALNIAAGGLDISVAEMLSKDLDDMRNKLIDSSATVSVAQPTLELNQTDDLGSTVDTDAFFKEAASKALGNGADELIKGYSTLDEMIGRTGGLPSGEEKIALPTDILFEYNEFELKEEARLSMMKLAFIVQTNPDATFIIEGHTDSFGGEDFNRELSLKRARAVRQWLIDRLRIDASNIQTVGLGKERPIVSTEGTADDQALNRRVEIVVRKD
ncbi:MAG: OmpA family protein [Verrucomicrobiales bacterium]|nr:OmpA family protein [Verrucomicrobiales bacterium]